ncbi:FAD-dependent oxidoreductase, partial [Pseudomonas aeruginosa]|nr:FAD-dependent oxidoreductase [Pseudomonas aeruginosa]
HDVEQFTNILGEEGVDELKRMGFEAVEIVRQRIERYAIDCDLTWGYCDLATKPRHLKGFDEDYSDLLRLGYPHPLQRV